MLDSNLLCANPQVLNRQFFVKAKDSRCHILFMYWPTLQALTDTQTKIPIWFISQCQYCIYSMQSCGILFGTKILFFLAFQSTFSPFWFIYGSFGSIFNLTLSKNAIFGPERKFFSGWSWLTVRRGGRGVYPPIPLTLNGSTLFSIMSQKCFLKLKF